MVGGIDPVVRLARVGDAVAVADVHVSSWRHAYAGLVPQSLLDGLSVADGAARWTTRLEEADPDRRRIVVAEVDGVVRGFAVAASARDPHAPPSTGELRALYLHPVVMGRGVGHLLHDRAVEELRGLGMTDARLWVLATNRTARAFYERHGWTPDGVDQVVVKEDVPLDATRYGRRV